MACPCNPSWPGTYSIANLKLFVCFFCLSFSFFETGLLCVTALAVLETHFVDQAGPELTEICMPRYAAPLWASLKLLILLYPLIVSFFSFWFFELGFLNFSV